ncbi:tRNA (guanine(27)-N(2))-dimethyltransferase isoform X1 [Lampetra fluviatilis]
MAERLEEEVEVPCKPSQPGSVAVDHSQTDPMEMVPLKLEEPMEVSLPQPDCAATQEGTDVVSASSSADRHVSIQESLEDLENLIQVDTGGKRACPLCSEEKFRPTYNHKLKRHLQNLHWKVSLECNGLRMCICHLPCRLHKQSHGIEPVNSSPPTCVQVPAQGKMAAHYHCAVCSVTIIRKTDMLSHLHRHYKRGETYGNYREAVSSGAGSMLASPPCGRVLSEADTSVHVFPNHSVPQKSDSFFNPRMKPNRQLVFCALAALTQERKPLACLDAFGATGIMGLQWAKHLGSTVRVTINDVSEASVRMMEENCRLNGMTVTESWPDSDEGGEEVEGEGEAEDRLVEVTQYDANVLMHLRAFDYIHLDPFGTAVDYLDAAFRNVRNHGIVSITSTDLSSLYCKVPNVALRHYHCNLVRTEYYHELAARMVLTAAVRAAGRCNKGVEVLLAVALEHFVLVVVRVLRGPGHADECARRLRRLVHCQWCEERVFAPDSHMLSENPYSVLPCDCHSSMPGRTAIELGPMWSGSLFNSGFLRRMLFEAVQHEVEDVQPLLKTLAGEAECTNVRKYALTNVAAHTSQEESGVVISTTLSARPTSEGLVHSSTDSMGKRRSEEAAGGAGKRQRGDGGFSTEHPPFYYSIHRHSIKGMNMPKLNHFLASLTEAGFRASRTHFDPTSIRTDATLPQINAVLVQHSRPTHSQHAHGLPVPPVQPASS